MASDENDRATYAAAAAAGAALKRVTARTYVWTDGRLYSLHTVTLITMRSLYGCCPCYAAVSFFADSRDGCCYNLL